MLYICIYIVFSHAVCVYVCFVICIYSHTKKDIGGVPYIWPWLGGGLVPLSQLGIKDCPCKLPAQSSTGCIIVVVLCVSVHVCHYASCYILVPHLYIESQMSLGFLCRFQCVHYVEFVENALFKSQATFADYVCLDTSLLEKKPSLLLLSIESLSRSEEG